MRIKTAGLQDIEALTNLLDACGLPTADIHGQPGQEFLLGREEDTLVGAVGMEVSGEVALLRSLAVEPNCRSRGLGSQLLNAVESRARSRRIRFLYLLTMTAADFFAARGFQRSARARAPAALQRTTEFKSVCPASAVCMKKELV